METKGKHEGKRDGGHGNLLQAYIHCIVEIVLWQLHF